MTVRNLSSLFKPASVALIGASETAGSVGAVLAANLAAGGFDGPLHFVNPGRQSILGRQAYPDVTSLPDVPELAIIATPAATVPDIVGQLGEKGTKAAVVISAGMGETGQPDGRDLQQRMLDAARPHIMRLVGPNCLGLMAPRVGLNASFAHVAPATGSLAFLAQSGAIVTAVLDWAAPRGVGFSHMVSMGNMADVDFGDMLDYLANDGGTRAILMYVEAITSARKFMSAARAAARMKPVVVVKAGRHPEGALAAASHTGALAGSDAVYDAAFRRSGILRVITLEELFDAAEILSMVNTTREGDRLAIVTNGGGIGVMATDSLMESGGRLAQLSEDTVEALDAVLPSNWSRTNPVDIIGDAPASRYKAVLDILTGDKAIDAILVLNSPTAVMSRTEAAQAVVDAAAGRRKPAMLTSWLGAGSAGESRALFARHRIPSFDSPEDGVQGFMQMVRYRRSQQQLMETPPSLPADFSPDYERARGVLATTQTEGTRWLDEADAKTILSAFGVPVAPTFAATTPAEAADRAAAIAAPVALKIRSPDLTHKTDVGGVVLNLAGPVQVREAAERMLAAIGEKAPDARMDGFTISPMVHRPGAFELIVGATEDPVFGPVILFGQGGTAVERIADSALALPPLNLKLARELISRTRVFRLLQGGRGQPPVNIDAVALALVRLSQLIIDLPEVVELDINPLLADSHGVIALDARIRVATPAAGVERLAIRPYPKHLEETIALGDGRRLLLRPIRPEDEPALKAAFARLSPEEIRFRFFVAMSVLPHVTAARFTQIDYDREMALILTEPDGDGGIDILGVVRIHADPDNEEAEFAIVIRREMTGLGLGVALMRRIIDYCRDRGIKAIHGNVLSENRTMLRLCEALGFSQSRSTEEPGIVRVSLTIS